MLVGCASHRPPDKGPINTINPKTAPKSAAKLSAEFAPYAMMAANSYHRKNEKPFRLDLIGWRHVDLKDNPTTEPTYSNVIGVQFDVFRHERDGSYVFAFRGSDSRIDWLLANFAAPFSIPYKSALKRFRRFQEAHPEAKITVVGHSLGGGEALSISAHKQIRAYVFDTSPRVFDGLGDVPLRNDNIDLRKAIYQKGEALQRVRGFSTKYSDYVANRNTYEYNFALGDDLHSSRRLAEELVRLGAKHDARLKRIVAELPAQPE